MGDPPWSPKKKARQGWAHWRGGGRPFGLPPSTRHREGDGAGRAGVHPRRGRPPPPPKHRPPSHSQAAPQAVPLGAAVRIMKATFASRRDRFDRDAPMIVCNLLAAIPAAAAAGLVGGRRPVRGRHLAAAVSTGARWRLGDNGATTTGGSSSRIAGSGDKEHQHHRNHRNAQGSTGKAGGRGASHSGRVGGGEKRKRRGEGAERGARSRVCRAVGGVNRVWGG